MANTIDTMPLLTQAMMQTRHHVSTNASAESAAVEASDIVNQGSSTGRVSRRSSNASVSSSMSVVLEEVNDEEEGDKGEAGEDQGENLKFFSDWRMISYSCVGFCFFCSNEQSTQQHERINSSQ